MHDLIAPLEPAWAELHGMRIAAQFPGERTDLPVQLADASAFARLGVKGAKAANWLHDQGVSTPPEINTWVQDSAGMLVARLARSEYFLEDPAGGLRFSAVANALNPSSGIWPVLRQDAALVLYGAAAQELLVQTCNINFRAADLQEHAVVMTSMVGVSVLVLWQEHRGMRRYRIWCDHSFGPYLWETLLDIARELGGGAVGLRSLFPHYIA